MSESQNENTFLSNMEKLSALNLITDMKDWFIKRTEDIISRESTFTNAYLEQLNISIKDLYSFISNTALDEEGSDILTTAIVEFQEILELKNQDKDVVDFFHNRVGEAFIIAFQKDQKIGQKILLNFMKSRVENSTKIDKVAIPTNAFNKQRANIKKMMKNADKD